MRADYYRHGKSQRGSTPNVSNENKAQVVSAQSLPSGRVLGNLLMEKKSNEITREETFLSSKHKDKRTVKKV